MAVVKNSIDKILQAAGTRTVNMPGTTAADWIGAATAAAAAKAAADAAQADATAANAALTIVGADNQLSKGEKPAEILRWNSIVGEYSGIATQADALGVSRTSFDAAYSALNSYLAGMTGAPAWTDVSVDTPIVGTTFRTNFLNYYNAKTALLVAISAKVQANAAAAQTAANTAKAAADAAQAAATAANAALTIVGADNWLSKSEKPAEILRWNTIVGEFGGLQIQADSLGVSHVTIDNAYSALFNHLSSLNTAPAWTDVLVDTPIDGALFRTTFLNYFNAKAALLNAVAAKIQVNAAAAQAAAGAANAALAAIFADNVLSRDEKPEVVRRMGEKAGEYNGLVAQAAALSVSSTAYVAANAAVNAYVLSLSPAYDDTTQNTTIVRADANAAWNNYYAAKVSLVNAILAKAATLATQLTAVDLGDGTFFGARNRNDAPSEYPMGKSLQFKAAGYIGLNSGSTYCTLETIKQYTDASGGGVYQYAYQDLKTYRRLAPAGNGAVGTWGAWVQDLDRNAYTGTLDATSNITLIGRNVTVTGNRLVKTAGANGGWDADAYSLESYQGGAYCSFTVPQTGQDCMVGLNTDPVTDSSYASLDFAIYLTGSTVRIYQSGADLGGFGSYTAGDTFSLTHDGVTCSYRKNGVAFRNQAVGPVTSPLFFDCSLNGAGMVIDKVCFGPLSSNDWAASGGLNRPSDNATTNVTLVARGSVRLTGNTATKDANSNGNWDSDVYSLESYTGGAYVSAVFPSNSDRIMLALNYDPLTDSNWTSLDYTIYVENGLWYTGTTGALVAQGGCAANDTFAITYDGTNVRWFRNGTIVRTLAAVITTPLYMDSSFCTPGAVMKNICFGPMSSNAWNYIGGAGKPADGATVGAPVGTNVAGVEASVLAGQASSGAAASAIVNNPPVIAGISNVSASVYKPAVIIGTKYPSATGGVGPYRFDWTMEGAEAGDADITYVVSTVSVPNDKLVIRGICFISGGSQSTDIVTCKATDSLGRVSTTQFNVSVSG